MKLKGQWVFQSLLGAAIIIGFFGLLILLLYRDVPKGNADILNIVVGALIGSFTTIVGYFFGSSKGSADKNELLRSGKEALDRIK